MKSQLVGLAATVVCSPSPVSGADAGNASGEVTVPAPLFEPTELGSKRTITVHDAVGARLVVPASHVPPLRAKPWPGEAEPRAGGSGFGPGFVDVNDLSLVGVSSTS